MAEERAATRRSQRLARWLERLGCAPFFTPLLDLFPIVHTLSHYSRADLVSDVVAGIVVAIMLVPQSMAYALLAGMPPQYGLYASMLPLAVYALLGSCQTLAVGPVAIASMMLAAAVHRIEPSTTQQYVEAAAFVSWMSAVFLALMRLLRLGFVVTFMSDAVLTGFTSAAAVVISTSQLRHVLGIDIAVRADFPATAWALVSHLSSLHWISMLIGVFSVMALFTARFALPVLLKRAHLPTPAATAIAKAFPLVVVCATTVLVAALRLDEHGVNTVGVVPGGLPALAPRFGTLSLGDMRALLLPTLFLSLVAYLETISVGTALAHAKGRRLDANRELIALSACNIAATLCRTFPVAGGFARSMVNDGAGARTTVASLISALLVALTVLFLMPLFFYVPQAVLSAIVLTAVVRLVDTTAWRLAWKTSWQDLATVCVTFAAVLLVGVELGILCGMAVNVCFLLYVMSQPRVECTLRTGDEERVVTSVSDWDAVTALPMLTLQSDIVFANARQLENVFLEWLAGMPPGSHLLMSFRLVRLVDSTGADMIRGVCEKSQARSIHLHFIAVPQHVQRALRAYGALRPEVVSLHATADSIDAAASVAAGDEP